MEVQNHAALRLRRVRMGMLVLRMRHRMQQSGRQVWRRVEGPRGRVRGVVARAFFGTRSQSPGCLLVVRCVALRRSQVAVVLILVARRQPVVRVEVMLMVVAVGMVGVVMVVMMVVVVVVVVGVVVVVAGQAISPATASHWRTEGKEISKFMFKNLSSWKPQRLTGNMMKQ